MTELSPTARRRRRRVAAAAETAGLATACPRAAARCAAAARAEGAHQIVPTRVSPARAIRGGRYSRRGRVSRYPYALPYHRIAQSERATSRKRCASAAARAAGAQSERASRRGATAADPGVGAAEAARAGWVARAFLSGARRRCSVASARPTMLSTDQTAAAAATTRGGPPRSRPISVPRTPASSRQ